MFERTPVKPRKNCLLTKWKKKINEQVGYILTISHTPLKKIKRKRKKIFFKIFFYLRPSRTFWFNSFKSYSIKNEWISKGNLWKDQSAFSSFFLATVQYGAGVQRCAWVFQCQLNHLYVVKLFNLLQTFWIVGSINRKISKFQVPMQCRSRYRAIKFRPQR